ncbi:multiple sugar transport system substrate-binding protein [Kibdelosporangium banguiense]|uniref:Multiple sugar transport system substrate-binding protein n=1 Tax=Kibdelosporangium banguiense TaxID=1365924 RepID=A0ABS4TR11_9PSEU|nr:ABC transporter substrate-binding protein [Kibdelosporangium banguiense]MBP2326845.1 multiple sugar transport system substrate-binding protein [Kibdelosporangium banguiense]
MAGRATALRLAAAVSAALLAASCGSSGTPAAPGDSGAAPKLEGRGDITFVTGKDTSNNMQKLVAEWNSAHPAEQVRIVELPESADAQRQQMVQNAQVKSDQYGVINLDVVWTAEFAANRWVVELPRDQFDLSKFLKPAVATAEYRDKLYAVPVYSDGGLLYYRKDLLEKAGVTPPKTWPELTAACQKILALPEAATMGCYAGQFEKYEGLTVNFDEAVHSAGGAIVDEAGKPTVDTPQAKAGLDILVQGFKSGAIPQKAITYKEEEGRRAFQAGELIFQRQWPYQWALANKTDGSSQVAGKFDVAPLPGATGPGTSSLGGHNFAISAFAKNKATALDFIKFFTTEQAERSNLLATSQAPTLTSLYDDPELTKQFPYLPTLKASILAAKPRPKAVRYGDVTTAIQESAYAALTGAKDSATALKELQAKLQDLIK